MGRLDGKVALISGSGGSQGRAASLLFAREGAKIVGSDRVVETAEETLRLVRDAGGEMISVAPVDLTSSEDAKRWIDEAVRAFGAIDILYNNAGGPRFGRFIDQSLEDWDYTIRQEIEAVHLPTRHAWPHLVRRGGGSIISTSSVAAIRGLQLPQAAHAAAKAAVAGLMTALTIEAAPHGIRVNTIMPGPILNVRVGRMMEDPNADIHKMIAHVPLKRIGRPEDVAWLALFLASDESSYITGASIVIDGGMSSWS